MLINIIYMNAVEENVLFIFFSIVIKITTFFYDLLNNKAMNSGAGALSLFF